VIAEKRERKEISHQCHQLPESKESGSSQQFPETVYNAEIPKQLLPLQPKTPRQNSKVSHKAKPETIHD